MKSQYACSYSKLVKLDELIQIQNPKNRNQHSKDQITRLAKIIDFQGQRSPIVVSNLSGFIVKGHCRLLAMDQLGWDLVAVDYQDYLTEAQEYADMIADNEIARWANLDFMGLKIDLESLDLGDPDLLGMQSFDEIFKDVKDTAKELDLGSFDDFKNECPKCGFEWDNSDD